jgi:hypothetical protein
LMLRVPLWTGPSHVMKFGPIGIAGDFDQPAPPRDHIQGLAKRPRLALAVVPLPAVALCVLARLLSFLFLLLPCALLRSSLLFMSRGPSASRSCTQLAAALHACSNRLRILKQPLRTALTIQISRLKALSTMTSRPKTLSSTIAASSIDILLPSQPVVPHGFWMPTGLQTAEPTVVPWANLTRRTFVASAHMRDLLLCAKDLLERAIAATRMVFNEQMSGAE